MCETYEYFDKGGTDRCQPCKELDVCRPGKLTPLCQKVCPEYYETTTATATITVTPATSISSSTSSLMETGSRTFENGSSQLLSDDLLSLQWGLIIAASLALLTTLFISIFIVISRRRRRRDQQGDEPNQPRSAEDNSSLSNCSTSVEETGSESVVVSVDEISTASSELSAVISERTDSSSKQESDRQASSLASEARAEENTDDQGNMCVDQIEPELPSITLSEIDEHGEVCV